MAARKKTTKALVRAAAPTRGSRGKTREGAFFPVSPPRAGLPRDYAETLRAIKRRIQAERLRVVMAANAAMVLLYWDIGRMILDRQERAGWGAKVIDRLSADLRAAYLDCRCVAGAGNRARGSCTNPLVPPHRFDGKVPDPGGAVLPRGRRRSSRRTRRRLRRWTGKASRFH